MAKKGTRLREFEMNHRVLDITGAQAERKKKKRKKTEAGRNITESSFAAAENAALSAEDTTGKKKKPQVRWVKLAGLVICAVFLLAVAASVKNIYDLKERESALDTRNRQLKQMKEELQVELENVNSDEYIEEKARRELKLIRANEIVFFFPDDFHKENQEKSSGEDVTEASGEKAEDDGDKTENDGKSSGDSKN